MKLESPIELLKNDNKNFRKIQMRSGENKP